MRAGASRDARPGLVAGPRGRIRIRRRLAAAVAALTLTACWTSREVDRRDWGAVPADETVRVTTFDGDRNDLTGVSVLEDALVGVRKGSSTEAGADSLRIPLDSIELVEVRRLDLARTALAAIAVGGTIGIVVSLGRDDTRPEPTASSCPFVYSFDGTDYRLDSETFAGAVARGLDRTDLDNLEHLIAVDGAYRLLLTNERPEIQYTDELALMVVDHPDGTVVLPDRDGQLHVLAELRAPREARGIHGEEAVVAVADRDGRAWSGAPLESMDPRRDADLRDGLILTFERPDDDRAFLAVTAVNTELAPFALRTYLELHGDSLAGWYRAVRTDADLRARVAGWIAREGTLQVSVLVDGEWVRQDALVPVGPFVAKTQVARIELARVTGDSVRIRLESARGLWIVDRVALGSGARTPDPTPRLLPLRVDDDAGPDGSGARHAHRALIESRIARADGAYYTAFPGDTVRLSAPAPPGPAHGWTRSALVRSRGYYLLHTRHLGEPAPAIAARILDEPRYGNRYMLERWNPPIP